jgi:hypothetical protein
MATLRQPTLGDDSAAKLCIVRATDLDSMGPWMAPVLSSKPRQPTRGLILDICLR